ncbi:hypothetical protein FRC07_010278 [Ceratobasidium sp. 392]|nr:hypothetical protein FRC07_010278 [Ceratobasidium sp. 392]
MTASPRWLSQLTEILSKTKEEIAFAFATVDTDGNAPIPRVRHHLYRDIIATNPIKPLLITTTDVRSPKVHQIRSYPDTSGPNAEVAWWLPPAQVQFRLLVIAYVLPSPSYKELFRFPEELLSGPSDKSSSPEELNTPADWEKYRVKTFNSIPGSIRAGFARPTPGSVLSNPDDAKKWPTELPEIGKEKSEEEKKQVEEALKNFAVLVLEPLEVNLSEFNPNRRTRWKRVGDEWKEEVLVP